MGQWFMSNILQGKEEYFTLIQKYSHYQPVGRMIEYNQIKGKGGERAVSEYVLELKGITKIFPGVKALNNVQFQLKPGEVHALMGENGAGKSTFIKVITGVHKAEERIGLEKLDHRTVSIDLQHLSTANRSVRQFDLHQFIEGRTLHLPDHHQWPRNFRNGSVFLDHISAPPFSVSWAICWAISRAMVS